MSLKFFKKPTKAVVKDISSMSNIEVLKELTQSGVHDKALLQNLFAKSPLTGKRLYETNPDMLRDILAKTRKVKTKYNV